jgi:hypothetical protein
MKCTREAQFYTRLDKVMKENIVSEFTSNIQHKQVGRCRPNYRMFKNSNKEGIRSLIFYGSVLPVCKTKI